MINQSTSLLRFWPVAATLLLCSCSSTNWESSAPASGASSATSSSVNQQAAAVDLPRSKRGNPPFYEVYGVRYSVMQSGTGYREKGVASWYGKKFHGRETSNGERYNMYAMTAAHKTLPLPTNVRVTNLENGKSIVVRVNDRGPFVKNRIIDLSYAAAQELDVVTHGTAMVEVVALTSSTNYPPTTAQARTNSASGQTSEHSRTEMYLQVGAFGELDNAKQLAGRLNDNGITNVRVYETAGTSPKLYKVRVGPLYSVSEYDRVSQKVEKLKIAETQLVVDSSG